MVDIGHLGKRSSAGGGNKKLNTKISRFVRNFRVQSTVPVVKKTNLLLLCPSINVTDDALSASRKKTFPPAIYTISKKKTVCRL